MRTPRLEPRLVTAFLSTATCITAFLILFGGLLWSVPSLAQEPDPAPVVDPPVVADDAAAPADTEAATVPLREQTIYIPYTKLREVFNKQGRGVFLPYEQFQALWQAARENETRPVIQQPPVGALISEVENEAVVGEESVRVTAQVHIELLTKGWLEVPLRLRDAAILSASIDGKPARLTHGEAGYALLVENPGDEALRLDLALEYAKAFTKSPGLNSVSFEAPQAPVNRWRIRVPEEGVKVNIHPLIAASEVPIGDEPEAPAGETTVLAFVGAAPTVNFDWTPLAEGASGLEALATVESQQAVTIEEGAMRTRTVLTWTIRRAELKQVVVTLPADQRVAGVFDANVRQWEVAPADADDTQTITIELFEPARDTQSVTIETERFMDETATKELSVPAVKAESVGRQQGQIVVRLAQGLRAEPARKSGLAQLDAGELPPQLAGDWDFAYRYSALPFDLALTIEKLEPRISVEELAEAFIEPERLTVVLVSLFQVERAGVFQLEFDIPAGYDIRQVRGHAVADAQPALVDSHHTSDENNTRLSVNLSSMALGRVGVFIELERRLDDPNLVTPTGKRSDLAVGTPRAASQAIERATGRILIYAPESLRLNPASQDGLRSISPTEALASIPSARGDRFATTRPVLALAYDKEPATLSLAIERRQPHLTVRQLLTARIETGVVKYEAAFHYDILYSPVLSLRIDVPADLAAEIRNQTPALRERVMDPPPADLPEGYVAWALAGESDLVGAIDIALAWERPIDKFELGQTIKLAVPALKPSGVDRAWGQIVLAKAETIDVHPAGKPVGLQPIDPQHDLANDIQVPDAARAFEFHDDWKLAIQATQYKLEEVKRTSIERGLVRMVATRGDQLAVQALYRMRSAQQRLEIGLPAEAQFDTQPLRINGQPAALERGDKKELFVPLTGQSPESAFVLELRYTMPGSASRLELPEFPADSAVQQVYLCVYLPRERAWLGHRGPWTDEQTWHARGVFARTSMPARSDQDLLNWVSEGVNVSQAAGDAFATDGRLYVFSALRPAPAPTGALRMVTLDENWLHVLVLGTIGLVGIVLLTRPFSDRVLAMAFVVLALVLSGIFLPTFSAQVLDGMFVAAVLLVLVMWGAWFVFRWRGRMVLAGPVVAAMAVAAASAGGQAEAGHAPSDQSAGDQAQTPSGSPLERGRESERGSDSGGEPSEGEPSDGGQSHE